MMVRLGARETSKIRKNSTGKRESKSRNKSKSKSVS